jgi:MFS family permease
MAADSHPQQTRRKTAIASFGGWACDAFDYQLFGLALPLLLASWKLSAQEAGSIISVALACAAIGGPIGGYLADRFGRMKILTSSIMLVTLATFGAAFVSSPWHLMLLKGVQGLGFGAEWAVGAVMLAEIAPSRQRGLFLGFMQSAWAVGWGAAVLAYLAATYWLTPETAWRAMFLVGILPAGLVFWIRRRLPAEPADPHSIRQAEISAAPPLLRRLLLTSLIGLGAHGGFHSLFTWLPTLLRTFRFYSPELTGLALLLMTSAFAAGCIVAGYLADQLGRKPIIALFATSSAIFALLFALTDNGPTATLLLALPVGFAAGGTPSVLGSWYAEMFPAAVRGVSVGLAYNGGRLASALLPGVIGWASAMMPLDQLVGLVAASSYGLILLILPFLPETRDASLIEEQFA